MSWDLCADIVGAWCVFGLLRCIHQLRLRGCLGGDWSIGFREPSWSFCVRCEPILMIGPLRKTYIQVLCERGSTPYIADRFGVSLLSVQTWMSKYRRTETYRTGKVSFGRPRLYSTHLLEDGYLGIQSKQRFVRKDHELLKDDAKMFTIQSKYTFRTR